MSEARYSVYVDGGASTCTGLFDERLPKHLKAKLLIAYHDELTAEFPEDQAEEVMLPEMDEVVNTALGANQPDWVPVEVDVEILGKWIGE